ncbi:hypothetical protein GGR57DRAFT_484325 [Xylariaceae sp. FL1272]|nr:hypothetical protein GGR57DRAFT_484325 [Xylariaceae sp. FL1272]
MKRRSRLGQLAVFVCKYFRATAVVSFYRHCSVVFPVPIKPRYTMASIVRVIASCALERYMDCPLQVTVSLIIWERR